MGPGSSGLSPSSVVVEDHGLPIGGAEQCRGQGDPVRLPGQHRAEAPHQEEDAEQARDERVPPRQCGRRLKPADAAAA
jgi:hypothetical protein